MGPPRGLPACAGSGALAAATRTVPTATKERHAGSGRPRRYLECTRPCALPRPRAPTHPPAPQVLNELGTDLKAKVRTTEFTSKLHLVDLAGSERVKRSGVTGERAPRTSPDLT